MTTHIIAVRNGRQAKGKRSDSYRTPKWLFKFLDEQYNFDFDICASKENALLDKFYSEENPYNGRNWSELGSTGFCNPPFSTGQKEKALAEAYRNMKENSVTSVFLIPSDVSNIFWMSHIVGKATKISIICGRINFLDPDTGEESNAGLGCALVEFCPDKEPALYPKWIKRDDIKQRYS